MSRVARILLLSCLILSFQVSDTICESDSEVQKVKLKIDVTSHRAPISPFIYGQFIEHLGRCIYGGIWAEMLEDRKFYYPITGETPSWEIFTPGNRSWDGEGYPYELLSRSPWLTIGDRALLEMDSVEPFVGKHSPRITVTDANQPAGIYQAGLHFEAGREYSGHIVLRTESPSLPITLAFTWGHGAGDRAFFRLQNQGTDYETHHFQFTSARSTDNGEIVVTVRQTGTVWIGTASIMPSDNLYGWRADTVAMLRDLNSPVYRWPGGNFVSGYNWKDGIGNRDQRPPRKNPAWKGIEHNDVGLHEYLRLCELIGAEPFIAVNTGLGGAEMAAEQVEYVNGSSQTKMGQMRASNGRQEPWAVKFWAVGNEMYGDWQLGHMPLEEYTKKHNQVADAMRFIDPTIQLIAVGAVGEWSKTMLENCSNHMEMISEHLYWQDREDLVEHVKQIPLGIRRIADAHRQYRRELINLQRKDIQIALDEWNYWYGANEFGELGVRYFLQDALGIAAGLHEFSRNSDIFWMANYAQTVNVIGAIKTTPTRAEFESTGLVLMMYRNQFGTIPVNILGLDPNVPQDIAAAVTADGKMLTLGVVNPTNDRTEIQLETLGKALLNSGREFVLSGQNRWSHNDPERSRTVDIQEQNLQNVENGLIIKPLSVTILQLDIN
jgi:alpha-N-arabinofuranosidase